MSRFSSQEERTFSKDMAHYGKSSKQIATSRILASRVGEIWMWKAFICNCTK